MWLLPFQQALKSDYKIVAQVKGGLGNQLFTYAGLYALAKRTNSEIEIDPVTGFSRDFRYKRQYVLDQFCVSAPETAKSNQFPGLYGSLKFRLLRKLDRFAPCRRLFTILSEFDPCVPPVLSPITFGIGYLQSESFFEDHKAEIRKEYRARLPLDDVANEEAAAIKKSDWSLALCVRAGPDRPYKNSALEATPNYYSHALGELKRARPKAHCFVFTDNPSWVTQNINIPPPVTYITPKRGNREAYQDLLLISECRGAIVGNSSFHWWGAWLGGSNDKYVVAPKSFASANPRYFPKAWHLM